MEARFLIYTVIRDKEMDTRATGQQDSLMKTQHRLDELQTTQQTTNDTTRQEISTKYNHLCQEML